MMNNPTAQVLVLAIQASQSVTIRYKDTDRSIEPHAIGTDKAGKILLRAYQTSLEPGWRLFCVDKIASVSYCANPVIGTRPGYRRGDSAMAKIEAQL